MAKWKILVADDEEDILDLMTSMLEGDERFEVLSAKDGFEALDIAQEQKPDLILLDIVLPGLHGWNVCQMLKADPETADIKIIMVSALAQDSHKRRAWQVGADGYVTKPFSPGELMERIEELLED